MSPMSVFKLNKYLMNSLRNNMIDTDQAQEFVWEIIDEVLNNADKIIFDGYIKRQLIPFTVQEAKTAILHIIDVKKFIIN